MANFSLWATFGLCLLKLCLTETQFSVSCRYAGVFHVEKDGRYSLTRSEAVELCKALNSTLPTLEQMRRAHKLGFETCRYGFIVGHIVIPRINPYHLCAANHTGIYKLSSNTTGRYDAYCYNATETRDKACEPIERLDTSLLNNHSKIVIDNADGSRYNADGTRHSGDSSTSGVDDENVGSGSTHDTTAMDASIRRSPSTSYFENTTPVLQLPDHSSGGGEKEFPPISTDDEFSTAPTDISLVPITGDFSAKGDGQQPASTTVDSQRETLQEISKQDHWNPSYTDEEEQYSSTAGRALVTSENEKREGPTQHPLLHSVHPGWISQDQSPANTAGSMEQHEFTVPGESDIEKESSHTAMASDYVAKQNDSTQDPLVYPGWDEGDDNSARPTVMDRIISSRENDHEKQSSSTAVTSPDGAHHEDPTQPPLPSDNEQGQGTAGVTHATNTPRDEVLHGLNPDDAEDHLNRLHTPPPTTVTSPDGAHHEDPTQPPLPSDNEQGQGTAGVTHATNTPRDEVLHGLNPDVTESTTDVVHQEEATKEPLAPGTQRGSESEQATTTDGSHVNFIPGLFPDAEDHLNRLHTPPPTTVTSPDGAHHEDPTQPPLPSDNEQGQGTAGVTHATNTPRDEVLHGLNPDVTESTTDVVHQEEATKEPLAPGTQRGSESEQATTTDGSHVNFIPGLFPDAEDHLNRLHTPPPTRSTSSIYGNKGPHMGDHESTPFPGHTTPTIISQQRSSHVPEWLIIVAALVALALILAVCIAVNSRRRCGQKKKLVINNGKGAVEDRKTGGLNGEASKSQEMVHLVHKEQSNDRTGACDEFLTLDETQNHQELDMKSGV
ncbi:CD44 antigen isoform X6 [Apteryx mantelli]|uniref:CD44 antigen n=1 Tax=Apteryx mantelli TaxID=2696672 RepID=A0ABM4EI77_9AVES